MQYVLQGPYSVICRGSCSNYTGNFARDARAAYQNALMWYITRNQSHWDRSTSIIDSWGTKLTNIIGVDTSLLVGLDGDMLVNAAEIMRWEGNWTEAGAAAIGSTGYSNQLYWLFARQSIIIGQANYGMVSIKALLSFAVYLDDVSMVGITRRPFISPRQLSSQWVSYWGNEYKDKITDQTLVPQWNYAINSYQNDICAGIYGNFDLATGQGAETGRDQGHAQGVLGWTAEAARVIQSQGTDVYSLSDNLLLKAGEYTAQYNLGYDVPYDPKFYRCEAILVNGPWSAPSTLSRGVLSTTPLVYDVSLFSLIFFFLFRLMQAFFHALAISSMTEKLTCAIQILYYQYAVKKGLDAPYITAMKTALNATIGGEQSSKKDGLYNYSCLGCFC